MDVVMGGCGSSILIDNQRAGHQSERGGEKGDMSWCRNNHPREWETKLTREIDQGCQQSRGHIGGLWP